jgi:PhnB protein
MPAFPDGPETSEEDKNLVMHVELRILGSHTLMGTDAPESMGCKVNFGNNSFINLQPDTREETKQLFDKLSAGGTVTMELQDMFWGDYLAAAQISSVCNGCLTAAKKNHHSISCLVQLTYNT